MKTAERKVREVIAKLTTDDIVTMLETLKNGNIPIGCLMDELEKRNPTAFNEWQEAFKEDSSTFSDLRKYMSAAGV